jgi:hypothetical protein
MNRPRRVTCMPGRRGMEHFAYLAGEVYKRDGPAIGGELRNMERFVKRENVARYRALLASDDLDPNQREMIIRLLAEEESKVDLPVKPPDDRH